jgi:hypothetical protein
MWRRTPACGGSSRSRGLACGNIGVRACSPRRSAQAPQTRSGVLRNRRRPRVPATHDDDGCSRRGRAVPEPPPPPRRRSGGHDGKVEDAVDDVLVRPEARAVDSVGGESANLVRTAHSESRAGSDDRYRALGLPQATRFYALGGAGAVNASGDHDLVNLIPHALDRLSPRLRDRRLAGSHRARRRRAASTSGPRGFGRQPIRQEGLRRRCDEQR